MTSLVGMLIHHSNCKNKIAIDIGLGIFTDTDTDIGIVARQLLKALGEFWEAGGPGRFPDDREDAEVCCIERHSDMHLFTRNEVMF